MQTKTNTELRKMISESGMTMRFIAGKIGIHENSLRNWCNDPELPKYKRECVEAVIMNRANHETN